MFLNKSESKLRQLNASVNFDDLRILPSNRLEALSGDRKGQYSIRINDQYRLCFRFEEGNAEDVEIIDYEWQLKAIDDNKRKLRKRSQQLFPEFVIKMWTI